MDINNNLVLVGILVSSLGISGCASMSSGSTLESVDTNGDGKISQQEGCINLEESKYARVECRRGFRHDRNRDGLLTDSEIKRGIQRAI